MLMANDATTVRVLLQRGGYAPIPVHGKVPALQRWQEHTQTNGDEIALWEKLYRDAVNTGILTARNPAIDIDLLDEAAAEAVEALAREKFEARGFFLVRIGKAPKRAIILRTDLPFSKMTRTVVAANGNSEKIEVLCDGQQVVVYGVHPETRHPYLWHGGEPGKVACWDLPYASGDELAEFLDQAVALLVREYGYSGAVERPKREHAAADCKTTNGAGTHRGDDWGFLFAQIANGHELHDASTVLAAKCVKAGMHGGATVNLLRALFGISSAPHDARYQDRLADLPREVASAERKYGKPEMPAPAQEGERFAALDRPPKEGAMQGRFTVEGLLPWCGVAILSGWPGTGKTHVVNDLMCSVATGMPFAGHEVARVSGAVLFAAEGADTAHARWGVLRHAKIRPHFVNMGWPADTPFPADFTGVVPYLNEAEAEAQYDAALAEVERVQAERMGDDYDGLGLVVIDTYNAALSFQDEQHNKVGPNQAIFNMLRKLAAKHDCCILVVDHLGKDQSKGPLGTIAKSASCDLDLRITGVVGEDGSVSHTAMTVHKLRSGAQGKRLPFELKPVRVSDEEEGMVVQWDTSPHGMRVPGQNKRHSLLMKAIDEAIVEQWQWVRVGENMNFKAADSARVRGQFETVYPATSAEGEKRKNAIRKAYDRAMRDSSLRGWTGSKTLSDGRVMVWRTDYVFADSYELSKAT
jgi:AAA domain/Bifunctional DNA primase/polymerase, N-terminal